MTLKVIHTDLSPSGNPKDYVYIKKSSNIRNLVSRGLHVLTEQEIQNVFTVEAQGLSIGKAITIIEILKRRLQGADLTFWQYNQLDSIHIGISGTTHVINKESFLDLKNESVNDVARNIKAKIIPILRIKLSRLPLELTDGWKEQKLK
ncbi:hypothetical protein PCANB_000298 [Pneumocystis canis]|nr:hypothetical protein PCK1_000430 [Pneumocystis canis]KAG5437952.1 hypothetical protein PCANB_000298 [Pneumocystis canis]